MSTTEANIRPDYDEEIQAIADYVRDTRIDSDLAFDTARHCLLDTLGCGLLALGYPECTRHLGPRFSGMDIEHGARVPGTDFELDPEKAAWDIGCIIRWLDYNDTWLAAEWGHPSDNLGGNRDLVAVLLDVDMPGSVLDGILLTRILRGRVPSAAVPPFARNLPSLDVPIVLVTERAHGYSDEEMVRYGGDRLVRKPVEIHKLTLTITEWHLQRAGSRPL